MKITQTDLATYEHDLESPFHRGEQIIQQALGVRDRMETFGRQVIRDHLPPQHRDFYSQLPMILVGHIDQDGWPWASVLAGDPGFISSHHPEKLTITSDLVGDDPLSQRLGEAGRTDRTKHDRLPLGFLGIDLESRRRNRFSATFDGCKIAGGRQTLQFSIAQTFGNCPQYIQKRSWQPVAGDEGHTVAKPPTVVNFDEFDASVQQWLSQADTFFVSSGKVSSDGSASSRAEGADVSHRGGIPGFVKVENESTLLIPDFAGNAHFNTLGNFLEYPKAGLLFVDFKTGDLLQLTGHAEIVWEHPLLPYYQGAERFWRFSLSRGLRISGGLPLRWRFSDYSANSVLAGAWEEAENKQRADQNRERWQAVRVVNIEDESDSIRSFYLEMQGGSSFAQYEAGQFLTIRLANAELETALERGAGVAPVRTYTVSSAPSDRFLRISVKREQEGLVSRYLHDELKVGQWFEVRQPQGDFHLDLHNVRPAILLAGGVGITPMIAMAREAFVHRVRTRSARALTVIASSKDANERAFHQELLDLAQASEGGIRYVSALSEPDASSEFGRDYHHAGRISKALLQSLLTIDDYDVYLCGPAGFMQSMYSLMRQLGTPDQQIYAEAFGPAAIARDVDTDEVAARSVMTPEYALVRFTGAGVEQSWSPADGSLLEFAESHGLNPEFSCRQGICGACKVNVTRGSVVQRKESAYPLAENEALLCCSMPAGDVVELAC